MKIRFEKAFDKSDCNNSNGVKELYSPPNRVFAINKPSKYIYN